MVSPHVSQLGLCYFQHRNRRSVPEVPPPKTINVPVCINIYPPHVQLLIKGEHDVVCLGEILDTGMLIGHPADEALDEGDETIWPLWEKILVADSGVVITEASVGHKSELFQLRSWVGGPCWEI